MSWVTVIWAMIASACLTLALVHMLVWLRGREAYANLLFAFTAFGTAGFAGCELWMMRAESPVEFGMALRWTHVPVWVLIVSLVGFVRFYLHAGRPWLAWTVCGVRTLSLFLDFVFSPNLNYREISGLQHVPFLGETVVTADGVRSPWMLLGHLSLLLLMIFVLDAAITVRKRGDRRRAAMVGGSIAFFVIAATTEAILSIWGIIHAPIMASPFFMVTVLAMSYELSQNVLRAERLSSDLRDSQQRMALATQAANLGLWVWEVSKDEIWMTDKGRALFGFTPEIRLDYATLLSRVHPEDRPMRDAALKRAIETKDEYAMEYRALLPDGTLRWIGARGKCINDSDGKRNRLFGVSMDVTSQKQAQERFRLVVEASPNGIILVDEQGRIVLVNASAEELFGYRREDLLGQGIELLVPERFRGAHPDHRAGFYAAPTARAMGAGRELFARRKDGTEFPAEIGISPIQSPEGTLVLSLVVDISARKQAEAEATQHRKELAYLSRVAIMGEMAGSLAHELNQPLGAIVTNAGAALRFLERDNLSAEKLHEVLQDIAADGRRAAEVIRTMKGMGRKETGARQLLNLNDVIAESLRLTRSEALAHYCTVVTELHPALPKVEANLVQLQEVFLNLILNAFEASDELPSVRRRVIIGTERDGDSAVRAFVRDFGIGLPLDLPERVFDRLFSTKREGMGIGLFIARSIANAHGGTLLAENAEGGGARFWLRLPTLKETRV